MKKFKFSLEKVLSYKEQVEDSLRNEHAEILRQIAEQEQKLEELEVEYGLQAVKVESEKKKGCTIMTLNMYESYLHTVAGKIKRQMNIIKQLRIKEEEKLGEVIQAKIETSSIDTIKDKRMEEYRQVEQKAEEAYIEEFVSNARSGKVSE